LLKRLSFLQHMFSVPLSTIKWLQLCEFISGSFILYHWFSYLILFQCHAVKLLWLYSIIWYQALRYIQQLYSFCLGLFLLFRVFFAVIWILGFHFSSSVMEVTGILMGLHRIYRSLQVICHFHNLPSHLLVSSVSFLSVLWFSL
jgi:hypothetical protein